METILIVEDDSTMLRGLKDNFEFKGYRVLTASDGEEGLNAAVNEKPGHIALAHAATMPARESDPREDKQANTTKSRPQSFEDTFPREGHAAASGPVA